MYHDRTDLTALIGSRICHDLTSPLGAIGNGVELLEMAGMGDSDELRLIGDSVAAANARIRFFRIAYGRSEAGAQLGGEDLAEIIRASIGERRIGLIWERPVPVERAQARRLCLGVQCLESALPHGGDITLGQLPAGWELVGSGERLRKTDLPWALIEGGPAPAGLTPAQVQFALLGQAPGTARVDVSETRVVITL